MPLAVPVIDFVQTSIQSHYVAIKNTWHNINTIILKIMNFLVRTGNPDEIIW